MNHSTTMSRCEVVIASRMRTIVRPSTINDVYPWGRSFDEYQRMFALSDDDLGKKIVGCGDGPASFNAEMNQRGHRVISCDPLYQFTAEDIRRRIQVTYPQILAWAKRKHSAFVWDTTRSPGELGRIRMEAMERFLADFEEGKAQGRYVIAALPNLPFADQQFDLALCSHFLFLYSEQLPLQVHIDSILEMARIAREVRVFPLLNLSNRRSCHLDAVVTVLAQRDLKAVIEPVPYEVQRGGNEMLRIT